jgi:hypothetical protein
VQAITTARAVNATDAIPVDASGTLRQLQPPELLPEAPPLEASWLDADPPSALACSSGPPSLARVPTVASAAAPASSGIAALASLPASEEGDTEP